MFALGARPGPSRPVTTGRLTRTSAPRGRRPVLRRLAVLPATVLVLAITAVAATGAPARPTPHRSPRAAKALARPHVAQPAAGASALDAVNAYRAGVGVGPVTDDPALDAADTAAAHCLLASGQATALHALQTALCPRGTDLAGASTAAARSLVLSPDASASAALAVARFEAAPLHALALALPSLDRIGFGSAATPDGAHGAALVDVTSGIGDAGRTAPLLVSPPRGWTVPGSTPRGGEWPDPLAGCPHVGGAAGPALWVATGRVASYPVLGRPRLQRSVRGRWVTTRAAFCTLSGTSYDGGSDDATARGRLWLQAMGADVLFPTAPLPAGVWRVVVPASGQQVQIGFRVA